MIYSLLADLVLLTHVAFVSFVVLGGLLVLRRPWVAWVHVPCALWGIWVVLSGWVCPLTPLENELREAAGGAGYAGGFLNHYVSNLLYPPGLTRGTQVVLGLAALLLNLAVYARTVRRRRG